MLKDNIYRLRTEANLSQEKFASLFDVSYQAVQKWESGASTPDLNNILAIAAHFDISTDELLGRSSSKTTEAWQAARTLKPSFEKLHDWEVYSSQLSIEYRQCLEEGLDMEGNRELFSVVSKMPAGEHREKIADVLFDMVLHAEKQADYAYTEPSDLDGIRALRRTYPLRGNPPTKEVLEDKLRGAWMGRICGCLLGKPVEGKRTDVLHPMLRDTGNFPLHRYIRVSDFTPELRKKYPFRWDTVCFADNISHAPADDDTNYTVMAQLLISRCGRNFTPRDVMELWLDCQPKNAYCTAERVAFRNFVKGYEPPMSAVYKNPYREWIGAQIRGDYFGYINPGDPALAAEMAHRDASISHVKNGIYGEMWIAAMLACAAVSDAQTPMRDVICGGLAEIPATSRLYEAIGEILSLYESGASAKDCFARIHARFDEHQSHDWCHTISNAMIVAAALLYGGGDYGKTICMAVETGFDTDCNAATAGSILGMKNGSSAVGEEWTAPIHGKLETSIAGMATVEIEELIQTTLQHAER